MKERFVLVYFLVVAVSSYLFYDFGIKQKIIYKNNMTNTNSFNSSNIEKKLGKDDLEKIIRTNDEWGKILPKEQYNITRLKETERAFTGKYWNTFEEGIYYCADCGLDLFLSTTKFESDCGWPSFWQSIDSSKISFKKDTSFGLERTEVLCARCDAHLGHIFDDGPEPTGHRYCINSASLKFKKMSK